jgi:hypothetical protein
MSSHVWASLFLWNLASLERENMPSTVSVNVEDEAPIGEARGEVGEREYNSKMSR